MILANGNFYFVKDQYFIDFPDPNLMSNKELINGMEHNRPCFYSLLDSNTGIYWFIPISSQVEKFQRIYDAKARKYKKVDTIVFGYVMGNKRAFLIQNMFPITANYINNEYIDSITNQPVSVNDKLKIALDKKANKVLFLQRKGHKLIFPDVLHIEKILITSITALDEIASTE